MPRRVTTVLLLALMAGCLDVAAPGGVRRAQLALYPVYDVADVQDGTASDVSGTFNPWMGKSAEARSSTRATRTRAGIEALLSTGARRNSPLVRQTISRYA